ncbi:MAG: ATP-binding cassette domain-containing protein [Pseudomonadota bacterium]
MSQSRSRASGSRRIAGAGRQRTAKSIAPSQQGTPFWVKLVTISFTAVGGLASLAIAAAALLVVDHVVKYSSLENLPLIAALTAVALGVSLFLDLARSFALSGAPPQHKTLANRVELCLAALAACMLTAIHPALAAGVVTLAFCTFLASEIETRIRPSDTPELDPAAIDRILSGREPPDVMEQLKQDWSFLMAYEPVSRFAAVFGVMVSLLVGGWLAADKVITQGGLMATLIITMWCVSPMQTWGRLRAERRRQMRTAAESAAMKGVPLAAEDEDPPYDPPDKDEFEGLQTRIRVRENLTGRTLVGPIEVQVEAGKSVGITGPPGAGKTLFAKSIICPQPAPGVTVSGASYLKGLPLAAAMEWFDSVTVTYLAPRPVLFPGSARDNILSFHDVEDDETAEIIAKSALGKIGVFGLDAQLILEEQNALRLSDANAQIVAVARALMRNPDLLILDTPEAGLPPSKVAALKDALQTAQAGGTAVVLISQSNVLLMDCDELLMLTDGNIIDSGSPEELIKRHGSGWSRIRINREMTEERRVHSWLRAFFGRAHDAENLARARRAASEFLTLSCSDAPPDADDEETIAFDFKWSDGAFQLTMHDDGDPIASSRIAETRDGNIGNRPSDVSLKQLLDLSENLEEVEEAKAGRRALRATIPAEKGSRG